MTDDQDDEPTKGNTGRDHKPKDVGRDDHAPTGHSGTERHYQAKGYAAPGLGGQTRQSGQAQNQEMSTAAQPEKEKADDRPYALRTGVDEIDQETAKTHQLIDKDEAEQKFGKGIADEAKPSSRAQQIYDMNQKSKEKDKDLDR